MRDKYRDKRDAQWPMSELAPKTPAERILKRFGAGRLATWTGRHRSRVHAWTWPTAKGGTGGSIPPRLQQAIIEGARRDLGEDVSFADFQPQEGEAFLPEAVAAE